MKSVRSVKVEKKDQISTGDENGLGQGLFVTATGTDVGKTFVTGLIVRKLRQAGQKAGYYKAALSGAPSIVQSDAGFVNDIAEIGQAEESLVSYWYRHAVSPHLAARWEEKPPRLEKILSDYRAVCARYDYVTVEGSGGILCPIRWDETQHLLLEDIVKAMELGAVVVSEAGLGSINAAVLTVEYLRSRHIPIKGIILNRYTGGPLQEDNLQMIEALSGVKVLALVRPDEQELQLSVQAVQDLYE